MNEIAETKICPFCAETIKAAARKCPFCNSRLQRYFMRLQEGLMVLSILYCFGALVFLAYWAFPDQDITDGRSFAGHRKDLEARKISVLIRDRGTSAHDYDVSGFITNKGDYPWRVENVELTISNAQGVTDVFHEEVKDPFVVQSHAEHPFVLECRTSMTNKVLSASARVENALDGKVRRPRDN